MHIYQRDSHIRSKSYIVNTLVLFKYYKPIDKHNHWAILRCCFYIVAYSTEANPMCFFQRVKSYLNQALIWLLQQSESALYFFTSLLIRASSKLQFLRLNLQNKGQQ